MTRPQIVRADTLDLQDKISPTAQDHTHQPTHPAPLGVGPAAPHQEATLRRVEDERSAQEASLQNGSRNDADNLRDEPGSDDENTGDNAAVRLNGGNSGEGDDSEMDDVEEDDLDDMDRISSSPSISDGGYSLPYSQNWREQGLSPGLHSSSVASSSTDCDSSSPFVDTPVHFPLAVATARRPSGVLAGSADAESPYKSSPTSLSPRPLDINHIQSAEHHRGEYAWPRTTTELTNHAINGQNHRISPRTQHLIEVERRLQDMHLDSQASLISEIDEEAAQAMLQPVPSPLPNTPEDPFIETTNTSEAGLTQDEDDSWTTDSDADSWDQEDLDKDDDSKDISFSDDPRFIDSGWGGECLQETEDIDFEFVYALHTFVATVEGQANATKGDTMVLLDDSNSYWWLVRVVKDSSIGYLPAEHIETPTERLARLNKHRNIDLSATMLGDTAEKTKNPLKKAIRRRNAKTVQFAPPTYVEASDYDYSSDEGDGDELFGGADPNQTQAKQQQQQQATTEKAEPEQEDGLKVQPLKVNGAKKDGKSDPEAEGKASTEDPSKSEADKQRTSDEMFERPMDPKVSRNGTLRNTDSFFKDETTETRKITLTPNLLRDDSSPSTTPSTTSSRERGPSLESLEKNGFADKVKDDKKKKEKKPGMLSGLFKRKDKKSKDVGALESFDSDSGKQSEEFGRNSPQSKPSDDLSSERPSTEQVSSPSRQPSKGKLQKPQRSREDSPAKTKGILKTDSPEPSMVQPVATKEPANEKSSAQPTSTMRLVSPEQGDAAKPSIEERALSPESRSRSNSAASKLNPISVLKNQQNAEPKPEKVKKAKQRVQLDDFDSDDENKKDPFADPELQARSAQPREPEPTGRLSESPVHVSVADAQPPGKESAQDKDQESDSQHPPGLTGDTSSQETSSPISTPTPDDDASTIQPDKPSLSASHPTTSPSPSQLAPKLSIPPPSRPAPVPQKDSEISPPHSSESTSLPAWSDSSLRTYLDDGSDIRDMLVVINDTTGVVPVGRDHPIMAQLFVEETKAVSGLSNELDLLLTALLDKRMKKANSKTPSPTVMKVAR